MPEGQDFENSEEELHGWEADWKLKDLWCSGWMDHPVFLQVADGAEQVGSGVELTPAGCQGLLHG